MVPCVAIMYGYLELENHTDKLFIHQLVIESLPLQDIGITDQYTLVERLIDLFVNSKDFQCPAGGRTLSSRLEIKNVGISTRSLGWSSTLSLGCSYKYTLAKMVNDSFSGMLVSVHARWDGRRLFLRDVGISTNSLRLEKFNDRLLCNDFQCQTLSPGCWYLYTLISNAYLKWSTTIFSRCLWILFS